MIGSGISFLGQSNSQIGRLRDLQVALADLQRQVTTQKKSENFSGLGFESLNVQRYRMDRGRIESYLGNIDTATIRINLMNDAMERAADMGRQLMGSIQVQVREGIVDIETIKQLAKDSLEFVRDLVNIDLEGRYLFAGSETSNIPYANQTLAETNMQTEVTNWLNGTQTTAQLTANVGAFSNTDIGFNVALSGAGEVSLRIDDTTEVDYTAIADQTGMREIMRALALAANMEQPDPAVDVPTQNEFHDVLNYILQTAKSGVDQLQLKQNEIGSKFNLITNIKDVHERDVALFSQLISDQEDVDTTEVIAQIQAMQTQLTASYEVTRVITQLTLINFI